MRELQQRGTREVFDIAADWCRSTDSLMRARGLDVIAQLGRTAGHPSVRFPEAAFLVASELVQSEAEIRPLSCGIFALGHLRTSRAVPLIIGFESHANADVRYAVACALGSYSNDAESITTLLRLSDDADPNVRDWATFGLGVLGNADTPEIRDGLAARLSDRNQDVREEAIVGLAKRQDSRAAAPVIELLEEPNRSCRVIEAALLLLGMEPDGPELDLSVYIERLKQRFP